MGHSACVRSPRKRRVTPERTNSLAQQHVVAPPRLDTKQVHVPSVSEYPATQVRRWYLRAGTMLTTNFSVVLHVLLRGQRP
jgi:hypothetical protein